MRTAGIVVAALVAALVAGCGGAGGVCKCGPGEYCDDATNTCLPLAAPDLAAAGADLGTGGGCSPKCSAPTPHCNDARRCVTCLADDHCPQGTFCKVVSDAIATCTPGCKDDARCGPGKKCCGGQCADVATDARNCGACGKACTGNHAQGTCVAGKCQSGACDPGWGDCNKNGGDGCETNLRVDANHCTACGAKCGIPNALNACADGCYTTACNFGWDDCNRDDKDGCETRVLADAANCGGCGKPCKALPNATASCTNGACVLGTCNMNYANCDGDPKNGCEVDLRYDGKNCGACGVACPQNAPSCSEGKCGVGTTYGPKHTFAGLTSEHFITQGCCSVNCMDDPATNADYFCKRFYRPNCVVKPGYFKAQTPQANYPKMHKRNGCTGNGLDIPNTMCDGGPCKIGDWNETTTGLHGLVCFCP